MTPALSDTGLITLPALQTDWREALYVDGPSWAYQFFDMSTEWESPGDPDRDNPFAAPITCVVGKRYQAAIQLTPIALAILLQITALPDGPTIAVDVDFAGPVPQSNAVLALQDGPRLLVADLLCGTGSAREMAMEHMETLARERADAGQFPEGITVTAYLANLRGLFAALDTHALARSATNVIAFPEPAPLRIAGYTFPRMVHVTGAIIALHGAGIFANITPDGLLCSRLTIRPDMPSDPIVQEAMVFPVRDDDTMDIAPICTWLASTEGAAALA
jgi:hypothetical protein